MKRIILLLLCSFLIPNGTIHFIYNANDDFFSTVGDFFHKSFSPKTYNCDLCQLTYGAFNKKKKWKNFLSSLEYNYTFIYKNQDNDLLNNIHSFPVIILEKEDKSIILLSTTDLEQCKNLDDLINKINKELNKS